MMKRQRVDTGRFSKAQKEKLAKVMREWKEGRLWSSSGQKVKNRKMALAIALAEAQRYGKKNGGR